MRRLTGRLASVAEVRSLSSRAAIVVAESPPRTVRLAAQELQNYVQKITGAHLPNLGYQEWDTGHGKLSAQLDLRQETVDDLLIEPMATAPDGQAWRIAGVRVRGDAEYRAAAVVLTAFYMTRQVALVFFGSSRSSRCEEAPSEVGFEIRASSRRLLRSD